MINHVHCIKKKNESKLLLEMIDMQYKSACLFNYLI